MGSITFQIFNKRGDFLFAGYKADEIKEDILKLEKDNFHMIENGLTIRNWETGKCVEISSKEDLEGITEDTLNTLSVGD